jgi:hypothetical protein
LLHNFGCRQNGFELDGDFGYWIDSWAVNKSLFERLSIGKAQKNLDIFTKFLLILKMTNWQKAWAGCCPL